MEDPIATIKSKRMVNGKIHIRLIIVYLALYTVKLMKNPPKMNRPPARWGAILLNVTPIKPVIVKNLLICYAGGKMDGVAPGGSAG